MTGVRPAAFLVHKPRRPSLTFSPPRQLIFFERRESRMGVDDGVRHGGHCATCVDINGELVIHAEAWGTRNDFTVLPARSAPGPPPRREVAHAKARGVTSVGQSRRRPTPPESRLNLIFTPPDTGRRRSPVRSRGSSFDHPPPIRDARQASVL